MTDKVRADYEDWHGERPIDREGDAPWHRMVRQHLDAGRDIAGKNVLEVACGHGGFSCWLATRPTPPQQLVAADFSAVAVRTARGLGAVHAPAIRWEIADIQQLCHRDEAFDTVISCETLEHVPSVRGALSELVRVLKRGGRLFVTTPNYFGPLGLYRGYLRLRGRKFSECGQPINRFMVLPVTAALIRRAGLRVTTIDAVGHYLPFPGRPPIRMSWLDEPRVVTRWGGHHSMLVAEKP